MKVAQKKYFGTDGIRNRVGSGMISPDQVLKLGWATGKVMKARGESKVMIGKDTRISGYMFESALEAGFIAAGVDVMLLGPMPTPAVAYLTQTFHADAGIVISASHNPHHDNGIKFFSAQGRKISDEIELEVEAAFEMDIEVVPSEHLGKARRIEDAAGRYIEFCKSTYDAQTKLDDFKVVLDCSHGATYHIAPHVFEELGAEVVSIGVEPDGININQNCGATHIETLQAEVLKQSADLGIAYDGDGDRVIMVDENGKVVDGDLILYILALYAGSNVQGVVGTVMSNLGVENALKAQGIDFERSAVGDRYVMQKLTENDWSFGAEPSGHVLCLNKISTGDGIVASLQIMSAIVCSGKSLSELTSDVEFYPQVLMNQMVDDAKKIMASNVLSSAISEAEQRLGNQGRILVRASGTEPLIRVMVEGADGVLVETLANELINVVKSEIS
ncbi:phosphoglucosamine mutase [Thiomicrorhabdus lithotrophica]|uniref:Phosphoglucosamine mutase n=1 Tax=Thiomicrorhabdus lithotrophica TaxID=2949997 RepID=A0ABY8C7G0_9GAMM|nr:phosphoglucosamine mutase [Thiomicrorhabdus lithotrophica]WEJ61901.1 phosphoglucosamine mutase [Thiomicrorhabdus lithotrophica]